MITIIGLGAGDISQISFEAVKELESGKKIYMRTEKHPVIEKLNIEYESFDSYYDSGEKFEEVYDSIAKKIIELGKDDDIIYAVPGHPRVAESTVPLIEKYADEQNIEVQVIASMSFIDAMYNALGFDPSEGFRLLDAFKIRRKDLECESNIIITQVYDRFIASNTKIKLMEYYEDEQSVYIVKSAGIKDLEYIKKVELWDLDRKENEFDHLTSIFIPKSDKKRFKDINDLKEILLEENKVNKGESLETRYRKITEKLVKHAGEIAVSVENSEVDDMIEGLSHALTDILIYSNLGIKEGFFDFEEICDTAFKKIKGE